MMFIAEMFETVDISCAILCQQSVSVLNLKYILKKFVNDKIYSQQY